MIIKIAIPEDYISKYKNLRQSLQLPLKLNLYFTLLEPSILQQGSGHNKKIQIFQGFSPLFYPAFNNLSKSEKAQYLYHNLQYVKSRYDKTQTNQNAKPSNQQYFNNIKSTGQISQTKLGLTYWSKVQMTLNVETKKIRLMTHHRNMEVDPRLYLIRRSKKYQNTFVLQAISEIVPTNERKLSIFFKKSIFQQIYNEIFKFIINYRNRQLQAIAVQQISEGNYPITQVSYIGKNSKTLSFLSSKSLNQFLQYKEAVMKKLSKAILSFETIKNKQNIKIEIDRTFNQNRQSVLYKLQSTFDCSAQQLRRTFVEKYRSQSFRYLIKSQQLERNSNKYTAVYQKLLFQTQNQTLKTVQQVIISQNNLKEEIYQNEQLYFQKGLKAVKINSLFQFLIIKIKRGSLQAKKSKLVVIGLFNTKLNQKQGIKRSISLKKSIRKQQIIELSESQKLIIMFLQEFSLMIFRKQEPQIQKIKKAIQQQQKKEQFIQNQNQQDEKFKNQFYTVQGVFIQQQQKKQQIVVDYQEKVEQQQKVDSTINQVGNQNSSIHSNLIRLNSVQSETVQHSDSLIQQQQSSQKLYIHHHYQTQPSKSDLKNRKLQQTHFIYSEWTRKPKGGLLCKDNTMVSQQKRVANYLIKNIGKRIYEQKGLTSISLPVTIFRAESHLQSIAKNLCFAPILLQKACKMEPIERMKMVILYALSVTISSISVSKPFNPILGQTLQVWIDGCPVYLEQISHHPPIISYYMVGRGYKLYGSIGAKINICLNWIIGYADQPNFVQFDDGTTIELNFGKMVINGIFIGERTFSFTDKMFAIDPKNKIFYQLKFGSEKSYGIFSKNNQPEDYLRGRIVKVNDQFINKFYKNSEVTYPNKQNVAQQICQIQGIWNQKIYFNKKQYIDFSVENGCLIQLQKYPLQSNSTYRKDIQYLKMGQIDAAQQQKQLLEKIQRQDRKLRQNQQYIFKNFKIV